MDVKACYEKLKEEHELPAFEFLDDNFEICDLEGETHILRKVRRHMIEKTKTYIDILEDIIHPNSTVSAYHEYKIIDESDRKQVYDIYSKLMSLTRHSQKLDLEMEPKEDARFISEVAGTWPELRDKLANLMHKLNKCWLEEEVSDKSMASYLG